MCNAGVTRHASPPPGKPDGADLRRDPTLTAGDASSARLRLTRLRPNRWLAGGPASHGC